MKTGVSVLPSGTPIVPDRKAKADGQPGEDQDTDDRQKLPFLHAQYRGTLFFDGTLFSSFLVFGHIVSFPSVKIVQKTGIHGSWI